MNFRKGDKVRLLTTFTVDKPEPDHEGDLRLVTEDAAYYYRPDELELVERAPLGVGDIVNLVDPEVVAGLPDNVVIVGCGGGRPWIAQGGMLTDASGYRVRALVGASAPYRVVYVPE